MNLLSKRARAHIFFFRIFVQGRCAPHPACGDDLITILLFLFFSLFCFVQGLCSPRPSRGDEERCQSAHARTRFALAELGAVYGLPSVVFCRLRLRIRARERARARERGAPRERKRGSVSPEREIRAARLSPPDITANSSRSDPGLAAY